MTFDQHLLIRLVNQQGLKWDVSFIIITVVLSKNIVPKMLSHSDPDRKINTKCPNFGHPISTVMIGLINL